jgi:hypothetical protein
MIKVLSTKLSIDDYNLFLLLTKLDIIAGLIKEESTSELPRFTIRHILNQVHNQHDIRINTDLQDPDKTYVRRLVEYMQDKEVYFG